MKTECYQVSCNEMSVEFRKDTEGGIETVTNMVNGKQLTRFEDWHLFQAFLQLCQDYGFKVDKYELIPSESNEQ